jgi:anti-sigma regulatory factor (Ser/Thr protein kinase)
MTSDPPLAGPFRPGERPLAGQAALDQAFDSGTLYALRSSVQAHAFAAGLPERRTDDVVIAIHELAANAIQHGAGRGRLRMWPVAGGLCFEVDDGVPDAGDPAARWPYTRGHGLWLVRQVADRMVVSSGPAGTRVTVVFALPGPPDLGD